MSGSLGLALRSLASSLCTRGKPGYRRVADLSLLTLWKNGPQQRSRRQTPQRGSSRTRLCARVTVLRQLLPSYL